MAKAVIRHLYAQNEVAVSVREDNNELVITVDGEDVLIVENIKETRFKMDFWKMRNTAVGSTQVAVKLRTPAAMRRNAVIRRE